MAVVVSWIPSAKLVSWQNIESEFACCVDDNGCSALTGCYETCRQRRFILVQVMGSLAALLLVWPPLEDTACGAQGLAGVCNT